MQDENKPLAEFQPVATTPITIVSPAVSPTLATTQSTTIMPTPALATPAAVVLAPTRSKLRFIDFDKLKFDNILELLFRFGFAAVFLINTWAAIVQPSSFLKLIENNFAAQLVGHYSFQLRIIALNDFILGLLILSGFKKKYVYAWAGLWLMIVTFFKTTSLV